MQFYRDVQDTPPVSDAQMADFLVQQSEVSTAYYCRHAVTLFDVFQMAPRAWRFNDQSWITNCAPQYQNLFIIIAYGCAVNLHQSVRVQHLVIYL